MESVKVINSKSFNLKALQSASKPVDYVDFEWYETNKRINFKISQNGLKIKLKFLNENPNFEQDDILIETETHYVAVNIMQCDCLVITPKNAFEMASICYEIGNRHIPLFFEDNKLLVAYEKPLFNYFKAAGFNIKEEYTKLIQPLKTTVSPHGDNKSLFTKIMQFSQEK
ncbi:MAG: urease accessory protein UreE [Chitinophagales bacterium]